MRHPKLKAHFRAAICLIGVSASILAIPVNAAKCSPSEVGDLFAYDTQTQIILDVEAAMARAQARHAVIPEKAAADISRKAVATAIPKAAFDAEYDIVRHRMVALLNVWRKTLGPEGDQFVHFGATTVDIYGTASVIQITRSLDAVDQCLAGSMEAMVKLADDHARTPMIGRTLGQHAQPITFGKKVSTWISEYSRHRQRISELRARLRRSAILKGPVGNYSGLGEKAIEVEQSFAAELGLDTPYPADWNGTRDVIAEYGLVLGLIARSHQRIGQEMFLLQGTDIGEIRERLPQGTVGSSSMPHKRNPRLPERLVHAGRTIPRLAEVLSDDVVNLFERDNTSRMTPVIEEISVESVRAGRTLGLLLARIEIDAARMQENIDRTRGFAMSQRVSLALAEHMGRENAVALVKEVIAKAIAEDMSFIEALSAEQRVTRHIETQGLARIMQPLFGASTGIEQVERTIAETNHKRARQ